VEVLYNEYRFSAAFSVASILVVLSLLSLVAKRLLERKARGAKEEMTEPADAPMPAPVNEPG
jgi:sulfate transport system permease protein